MTILILNVLFNFQAKYDARMSDSKKTLLPFTKSKKENPLPFDYKYHKLTQNNGYMMNGYKSGRGADHV